MNEIDTIQNITALKSLSDLREAPLPALLENVGLSIRIKEAIDRLATSQKAYIMGICLLMLDRLGLTLELDPVSFFDGREDLNPAKIPSLDAIATNGGGLATATALHGDVVKTLADTLKTSLNPDEVKALGVKAITYPKWMICQMYLEEFKKATKATRANWLPKAEKAPEPEPKKKAREANERPQLSKMEKDTFTAEEVEGAKALQVDDKAAAAAGKVIDGLDSTQVKATAVTLVNLELSCMEAVLLAGRKVFDELADIADDKKREAIIARYARAFKNAATGGEEPEAK